jgi:hypothetical protein
MTKNNNAYRAYQKLFDAGLSGSCTGACIVALFGEQVWEEQ